jgi:hypothetical protein
MSTAEQLARSAQDEVDSLLATGRKEGMLSVLAADGDKARKALEDAIGNRRPATNGFTVTEKVTGRGRYTKWLRFTIKVKN